MSLSKLSMIVFFTCIFLGFWVADELRIEIMGIAAGIAALTLALDK